MTTMTMKRLLLPLVALIALASVANGKNTAALGKTFLPRGSVLDKQLSVRAGGIPLDPDLAAKTASVVALAQGSMFFLSPSGSFKAYGVEEEQKPLSNVILRRIGSTMISFGIIGLSIFFEKHSVATAVGLSSITWLADLSKTFLDDEPKSIGFSAVGHGILLAINSAVAVATLADSGSADAVVKGYSLFILGSSAMSTVTPSTSLKLYGGKQDDDDEDDMAVIMTRSLGFSGAALGTFMAAVAWGSDPSKALGYGWCCHEAALIFRNLLSDDTETMGASKAPQFVWMAVNAVIIAASIFGTGGESSSE